MISVLVYSLGVLVFVHVAHLLYKRFLWELAYLGWNRAFLITANLVALVLPLIPIALWPYEVHRWGSWAFSFENPENVVVLHRAPVFASELQASKPLQLVAWFYTAGLLFFALRLGAELWKIRKQIKARPANEAGYRNSNTAQAVAWSFGKAVFLSPVATALPEHESQMVLEHEKAHGKQGHTFDIVLYELLTVLMWYNPWIPKLKAHIVELHEYLADRAVVRHYTKADYSKLLLKLTKQSAAPEGLSSNFNPGLLSKRIYMLNRPPQEGAKALRFTLVVLLSLAMAVLVVMGHNMFVHPAVGSTFDTTKWLFPLRNEFAIVQPYVEQLNFKGANYSLKAGSKRVVLAAADGQRIEAPANALVEDVLVQQHKHTWYYTVVLLTDNENRFVIGGLPRVAVKVGQELTKGSLLCYTTNRLLYPTFYIEWWDKGKRANPLTLYR